MLKISTKHQRHFIMLLPLYPGISQPLSLYIPNITVSRTCKVYITQVERNETIYNRDYMYEYNSTRLQQIQPTRMMKFLAYVLKKTEFCKYLVQQFKAFLLEFGGEPHIFFSTAILFKIKWAIITLY